MDQRVASRWNGKYCVLFQVSRPCRTLPILIISNLGQDWSSPQGNIIYPCVHICPSFGAPIPHFETFALISVTLWITLKLCQQEQESHPSIPYLCACGWYIYFQGLPALQRYTIDLPRGAGTAEWIAKIANEIPFLYTMIMGNALHVKIMPVGL